MSFFVFSKSSDLDFAMQPSKQQQREPVFKNPFSERPPIPAKGDDNADTTYLAVGKCLTSWEYTEGAFAAVYVQLLRPDLPAPAARKSYGSIEGARTRAGLIRAANEVFFNFFADADCNFMVLDLMKIYEDACWRRNDIAHGMVIGNAIKHVEGFVLTANLYGARGRGRHLVPRYAYNADQMNLFSKQFTELSQLAIQTHDRIGKIYRASPKTRRERY